MLIFNFLNNRNSFGYYFISPLYYAIGTAAEQIYIAQRTAESKNKKMIILFPNKINYKNYKICNSYLFKNLIINDNDKINFFVHQFFNIIFNVSLFFLSIYNFIFRVDKRINYPNIGLNLKELHLDDKIDLKECKKTYEFYEGRFSLPKKDEDEFFEDIKRYIDFNKNKKIVTIHFRDSLYRKDYNRRIFRNSSIKNAYKAINYLLDKGYFVVRIGNLAKEKFNINHPNFLDYPFSKIVSDKLDVFFIKNSNFFIGTQSGLVAIADIFNVPVLLLNMYQLFEGYPKKKCDRGIFKNILFKKDNKNLSIEEFMKLPHEYHHSNMKKEFYGNLEFYENTEIQIYTAIKEFEFLYSRGQLNLHTSEQIKFNKLLKKYLIHIYNFNSDKAKHNKHNNNLADFNEFYKNLRYGLFIKGAIFNIKSE